MKSVVLEIRDDIAAILSDDGRVVKVKNQNYVIGQVIEMKETTKRKIHLPSAVAVAAVAVVMFGMVGVSAYAYYTPYTYVSLDVNPSIEYSLNRFDRVLKVTGVNDDGKEILKELDLDSLSNKKIDEAIALTVKQIEEDGFFNGDEEEGIVISTSAKDLKKAAALAENLKQSTEDASENENIDVESFSVGLERVQEARNLGVTPGKLNLVEKLRDSSQSPDNVDMDDWLNKPVKEIMKEIKENRIQAKSEAPITEGEATSQDSIESESNIENSTSVDSETTEVDGKPLEKQETAVNSSNSKEIQSKSETDRTNQGKQNGNLNKQEDQKQTGKNNSKP